MDCSTPGFSVHHQLLQLAQTHIHQVGDAITISSSVIPFSCSQSFPASGFFLMSRFFTSGGQNIGVSASASVLPMNIEDWFPLGLTCLISLQSKGLSRVFSSTTVRRHQFFGSLFYCPTLTSIHDYGKNHSFSVVFFLLEKPSRQPQICLRICLLWTSHMSEIIWMGCDLLYLSSFTSSINVVPCINTLCVCVCVCVCVFYC